MLRPDTPGAQCTRYFNLHNACMLPVVVVGAERGSRSRSTPPHPLWDRSAESDPPCVNITYDSPVVCAAQYEASGLSICVTVSRWGSDSPGDLQPGWARLPVTGFTVARPCFYACTTTIHPPHTRFLFTNTSSSSRLVPAIRSIRFSFLAPPAESWAPAEQPGMQLITPPLKKNK